MCNGSKTLRGPPHKVAELRKERKMGKAGKLVGYLTPSERQSLRSLAVTRGAGRIREPHQERLIELGLAELDCGTAGLTGTGRRVLQLIAAWEH